MTDLYAVLKVPRDATAAQIKRAYRKASMRHHPDRHGDPNAFKAAAVAYRVLSDPVKRERYDATGQIEESPDNTLTAIMGVLTQAFLSVMEWMLKANANPAREDVVHQMRCCLKQRGEALAKQRIEVELRQGFLACSTKRFEASEGENHLDPMVRSLLANAEVQLKHLDEEIELTAKATAELKRFTFKHEAKPKAYTVEDMLGTIQVTTRDSYIIS